MSTSRQRRAMQDINLAALASTKKLSPDNMKLLSAYYAEISDSMSGLVVAEDILQTLGMQKTYSRGEKVVYDPQQHKMISGSASRGDVVVVIKCGWSSGDSIISPPYVSSAI